MTPTTLVCASCGKPVERTFDDDFQHETTADGVACTAWPVVPVLATMDRMEAPGKCAHRDKHGQCELPRGQHDMSLGHAFEPVAAGAMR